MSDLLDRIEDELERLADLLFHLEEMDNLDSKSGYRSMLLVAKAIEEKESSLTDLLLQARQNGCNTKWHTFARDVFLEISSALCGIVSARYQKENLPDPANLSLRVSSFRDHLDTDTALLVADTTLFNAQAFTKRVRNKLPAIASEIEGFRSKEAHKKRQRSKAGKESGKARLDDVPDKKQTVIQLIKKYSAIPSLPARSITTKVLEDDECPYKKRELVHEIFKEYRREIKNT